MATLPLTSSKLQSLTFKNSSLQNPTMIFFITGFIFSVCFTILLIILKKTCPKKDDQEVKVQSLVEKSDQNEKFENTNLSDDDVDGEREAKKKSKRKKRGKKKKKKEEDKEEEVKSLKDKELISLYPFTSTGSATQRKIKQQYDHLVKCNSSKGLTIAQVGEFANCLVEARNELRHKSEYIQRKFTITKALLFKADRSSFDRLRQQIYKLEVEQKRLEEDAFVYNWLQEHLKLSPAYKKMIEISESMELKAKSKELAESIDDEFSDISFEELLVQEKKDSFWQKHGKAKQWSR